MPIEFFGVKKNEHKRERERVSTKLHDACGVVLCNVLGDDGGWMHAFIHAVGLA